jgi:hypothetical protein
LTPKHEFELDVKLDVEARVRQGVKGVLEEVLEERKEHGSYVRPTSIIGASSAARRRSGRCRGAQGPSGEEEIAGHL